MVTKVLVHAPCSPRVTPSFGLSKASRIVGSLKLDLIGQGSHSFLSIAVGTSVRVLKYSSELVTNSGSSCTKCQIYNFSGETAEWLPLEGLAISPVSSLILRSLRERMTKAELIQRILKSAES